MKQTKKVKTPKKPAMDTKTKERRVSVIKRLQKQLKDGKKPLKENGKTSLKKTTELTDKDKVRIEKEIAILEGRI